ncbi:type IV secretory system conjugative DNA transfer family protein [Armatimonas sp.]|uniref:type IV secretory system conjugative DNA transfer family protein n=1 Tax=Armatimonas sp. TaxID=1872638 RepID=UPI00374D3DF4
MSDLVIGTKVDTGGELARQGYENLYDDPEMAKICWKWIKMYLEAKGDKREITAIETAMKEREVLKAISPASFKALEGSESGSPFEDGMVTVSDAVLRMHTLIFGSSGYGKTYFAHVLIAQMLDQGCSLIAVDPKPETLRRLRASCEESGIPASKVVTLDPSEPDTLPAFNPLVAGDDPDETVRLFLDWMKEGDSASAPRMWKFLRNALVVAVWHGLRPQDILRLLDDQEYRHDILRQKPLYDEEYTYAAAETFFLSEYLDIKKADRDSSISSLETRFDELLGNRTFQKMMNAPQNTLDIGKMFTEQRVLLVSTGSAGGMTRSSVNMLVSYVLHMVNGAAASRLGNVPVVLYMDEVGSQDASVKQELSKVANLARERNVRLILAAQHPHQFAEQLRRDVMSSSALKAYFHNDEDGAEKAASVLAGGQDAIDGTPVPPRLVPLGAPVIVFSGMLYATKGSSSYLTPLNENFHNPNLPDPVLVDPADPGPYIKAFSLSDTEAKPPVCFQDGNRFSATVKGLPHGSVLLSWRDKKAYAVVRLPMMGVYKESAKAGKPNAYWLKTLKTLPVGRAVVAVGNEDPVTVDVLPIDPPTDASPQYLAEMRDATAAPYYKPPRLEVPPKAETPPPKRPIPPIDYKVTPDPEPSVQWEADDD